MIRRSCLQYIVLYVQYHFDRFMFTLHIWQMLLNGNETTSPRKQQPMDHEAQSPHPFI